MGEESQEKVISITKSNQLSTASYYLTSEEQRLILACIGQINPMDPNGVDPLRKYIVTAEDYKELFKLDKNVNVYQILKKVSKRLFNRSLWIDIEKEMVESRWVSQIGYAKNEGYVSLVFSPIIVNHLCHLKKNFNSYRILNVQKMESIYGFRIYELLMSLEGTNHKRTFKIDELKAMLGIENKYKLFGDFQKKVLFTAKKDINSYSDLYFDWEVIKEKRKVVAVRLKFEDKPESEKPQNKTNSFQTKKESDKEMIEEIDKDIKEWFNSDVGF